MITLCEECLHVEPTSKKGHPASWLCVMHKQLEHGFVSRTFWGNKEPYLRCIHCNGGCCPLYKPLRNADGLV